MAVTLSEVAIGDYVFYDGRMAGARPDDIPGFMVPEEYRKWGKIVRLEPSRDRDGRFFVWCKWADCKGPLGLERLRAHDAAGTLDRIADTYMMSHRVFRDEGDATTAYVRAKRTWTNKGRSTSRVKRKGITKFWKKALNCAA
jgi:hypothetical protein